MSKDEIFAKVKELIIDELQCDESLVTLDASFESDLGADSLDAIELVCSLEDTFNIQIADEDTVNFKTVGQIVDYIENNAK